MWPTSAVDGLPAFENHAPLQKYCTLEQHCFIFWDNTSKESRLATQELDIFHLDANFFPTLAKLSMIWFKSKQKSTFLQWANYSGINVRIFRTGHFMKRTVCWVLQSAFTCLSHCDALWVWRWWRFPLLQRTRSQWTFRPCTDPAATVTTQQTNPTLKRWTQQTTCGRARTSPIHIVGILETNIVRVSERMNCAMKAAPQT